MLGFVNNRIEYLIQNQKSRNRKLKIHQKTKIPKIKNQQPENSIRKILNQQISSKSLNQKTQSKTLYRKIQKLNLKEISTQTRKLSK